MMVDVRCAKIQPSSQQLLWSEASVGSRPKGRVRISRYMYAAAGKGRTTTVQAAGCFCLSAARVVSQGV